MMNMMAVMTNQSSMWTEIMRQKEQREKEEDDRRSRKEEHDELRRRQKEQVDERERWHNKSPYSDGDDEEEAQMVRWSGSITLPKLEHNSTDPAMECGDWIARIAVVMMDLSQRSAKW